GERWGRHWLDVARYSDAKGYVDSGEPRNPFAYTYRDYVISAFNRDLGFDQFAREQIAADQLAGEEPTSLAALGFLTVGSRYNFFPHEIIDDRIDVVTRGFLGLTVQCARCHDHKFDPISARDYYSLYSVFANSIEPTPDQAPRIGPSGAGENEEFARKLEESAARHIAVRKKLHERMMHEMRAWAGDYLRYIVQTTPEHRTQPQAELRTKRGLLREFSAYAGGGMVRWRRYLESRSTDDPIWGMWQRLTATPRHEIADRFQDLLEKWSSESSPNQTLLHALRHAEVANLADAADVYGEVLESTVEKWEKLLAESPEVGGLPDSDAEQLRQMLYGDDSPATIRIEESDDVYTLDESVEARTSFADIERVFLESWQGVAPRPMLLADRLQAREQRVFLRGDARRPGEVAPRVIPAMVTGQRPVDIHSGSGRKELSEAIASPDNPLTARVIVNRVWAWHFGRGLVATPSDFGVRSKAPTHPELLDYLALWFMEHDWSLKQLHRLILNSRTWQQSSIDRPECRAIDSENQLLWRANRQRLDFETMRDAMLAVSGRLEAFTGGPPVEKAPDDPENRCRTLYGFVDREKLPEIYSVFDFPSPDISAPERSKTTVPQQALFLLNNPFVAAQADAVAATVGEGDPTSRDAAIFAIYRQVLGRDPDAEEMRLVGEWGVDGPSGLRELAQALLLSNEFLFSD
ncbi:MAG: DUF1553 domain-containing protein, partial [Verrucomicrobiae bacterium]|nr:DUF1553 domain-containing protein [Verrucomicrobiae bacterium]